MIFALLCFKWHQFYSLLQYFIFNQASKFLNLLCTWIRFQWKLSSDMKLWRNKGRLWDFSMILFATWLIGIKIQHARLMDSWAIPSWTLWSICLWLLCFSAFPAPFYRKTSEFNNPINEITASSCCALQNLVELLPLVTLLICFPAPIFSLAWMDCMSHYT